MFNRLRAFLLSLTIIAVLVFSAVGTTVVYADGETPPTESTSEAGEKSEEPDTGTAGEAGKPGTVTIDTVETPEPEAVATEAPAEEVTPAEGEATPAPVEEEKAPAEEPAAAPEAPAVETPILNAVPDNTTVTVLNAKGESQPLATPEAAEAIISSDPIWCPAGQAPTPGANGCTQSFNSFTALLTFIAGNATYSGAGTIYVEQGNYQGGESTINFNNFNLTNISSSELTITGGWNTSNGTTTSTSTFNNVSLIIGNSGNPWGGTLSLNNITITNPAQTGINLNTNGNINLTNVTVTNSTNGAGAELTSGGNVTIQRSHFDRNKTAGALIRAAGGVAIGQSSFSNPETARRQIIGVDIISGGDVTLFEVLANENRQVGAHIDAVGRVSILNSEFSGTKAIVGSEFLGYGLTVVSQNAIDLDGVIANDNFLWGASLTAAENVTIANSIFNANTTESPGFIDDTGLLIDSGGSVSIFNTQANDNRLIGATIIADGDVTIGNSTFSSNNGIIVDSAGNPTFYGYGLQVISQGNISLTGVTASENTLFGAHLEAGVDVTIANSNFSNQTSGTDTLTGRGLEVVAGGNVFLDNVTVSGNQTFGADIKAGGDVFLNVVTASGNGANGITVETNCGTLFLIGGTYTDNGQYGLSVLSTNLNQTIAPLFANNAAGNIFENAGTCVFTPPAPPPVEPPDYRPNDLGAIVPSLTGGSSLAGLDLATLSLNGYLASFDLARTGLLIGPFTGKYGYVDSPSGMLIVIYEASSFNELAMNGA